jgi:predicted GIY-YIG superfamily endonuclease
MAGEEIRHHVYMLCSPAGDPFYVGVASNPRERLKRHRLDRTSAAYAALLVFRNDARMVVVASFDRREAALDCERLLIKRMNERFGMLLLNRVHHGLRSLFHRANPDVTEDCPCPFVEELTYVRFPEHWAKSGKGG